MSGNSLTETLFTNRYKQNRVILNLFQDLMEWLLVPSLFVIL